MNQSLKLSFLLVFSLLLFFPSISAVQISMNQNFSQGETLLAVISGTFINQITTNNVAFYRQGHLPTQMASEGVVKIGDDYYIYASLFGKIPDNYTMNISGVNYMQGTQQINTPFSQNFLITNDTFAFSTNPGAINTQTDFSVQLQNLIDQKITVTYGLQGNSTNSGSSGFFSSFFGSSSSGNSSSIMNPSTITLNPGQTVNIPFQISQFSQSGLVYLEFSSLNSTYDMPVYLNTNQNQQQGGTGSGTEGTASSEIAFQPNSVAVSLATNSNMSRILYLTNTGNETISDISFNMSSSLEPYIILNPNSVSLLNPGTNQQIEIDIASGSSEATVNGTVTAYNDNFSTSFDLNLNFINNFNPSSGNNSTIVTTCAQLNGTVCNSNQTCSGQTANTNDYGTCCLNSGICQEPTQTSFGWIGWILLVVALLVIYIFYKKRYKKVQPKKPF
ncbi:MAG: hypothetical protein ABSG05_01495 [Candidatus Pacearchaeota archaeon]|jgi:hypothetical protein